MDHMQIKGLNNAHHVFGVVSVLELHTAFYKIHCFQRSIANKPDKQKAYLSIHLKELLKKSQISLAFFVKCNPVQLPVKAFS